MIRTLASLLAAALVWAAGSVATAAEPMPPGPTEAAAEVNKLWVADGMAAPEAMAGDEVFLRRLTLDIAGRLPTPEEVSAFVLDPAANKRGVAAERLLSTPEFGQNWGRYWRDVILSRRLEDRALLVAKPAEDFFAEKLNTGAGWDEIAAAVISATGDVREDGSTILVMSQMAMAEETAAEVSRVFLGVQIQCAQCHDHPTDRWNRQQFHELAAFFPRMAVRPVRNPQRRSFQVVSVDRTIRRPGRRTVGGEHFMPNLEDPESRGTVMKPVLFTSGQSLVLGQRDQQRRQQLANWITDKSNPWFAKAFINRMWAEMVGTGFYEPVDDLGPDRMCSAPETLDYLATQFAARDYDVKWLVATIAGTQAYQAAMQKPAAGEALAACCTPTRLRSDQVYDALSSALGLPETQGRQGPYGGRFGPRQLLARVFGYDPSEPREEVTQSIPQALLLMNSPVLNQLINADNARTQLGRLLRSTPENDLVVLELYLKALGREPSENELATCLNYIKDVGDRGEACEDILWALINSTEFLHRR